MKFNRIIIHNGCPRAVVSTMSCVSALEAETVVVKLSKRRVFREANKFPKNMKMKSDINNAGELELIVNISHRLS